MKQILKSLELIQDGETTITVKPEDYLTANYQDCNDCPMARAIKRTLGASYVSFGSHSCHIEGTFSCGIEEGFKDYEHKQLLKSGGSLTKKLSLNY